MTVKNYFGMNFRSRTMIDRRNEQFEILLVIDFCSLFMVFK